MCITYQPPLVDSPFQRPITFLRGESSQSPNDHEIGRHLELKPTRNQELKNVCRYREPKPAASHCTEQGSPLVQISVNKQAGLHFKHTRTILQVIKTSVVGKLAGLQVALCFLAKCLL